MNETEFLKTVARHELTIHKWDGLYRHVRFADPGNSAYGFDLVTWPGHLCFTGDCGTYVFARVPDTFTFFRSGVPYGEDKTLGVNLDYWAQKLLSEDRSGGTKVYSAGRAATVLQERLDDMEEFTPEKKANVMAYLSAFMESEHELRQAIEDIGDTFFDVEFSDFGDEDLTEWTVRYRFCAYAIVWGIHQLDARAN